MENTDKKYENGASTICLDPRRRRLLVQAQPVNIVEAVSLWIAPIQTLCIRIAVVCFCGGIGIALPMLEQIINIVGALFYSMLGLIIPGVVDTVFHWKDLGRYKWVLWKNSVLVAFGFLALVSGCAVTVMDIVSAYGAQ